MWSTSCQFHSVSRTNSVYSFFNHYTELPPTICSTAALGLILPRPGYGYNHLRGPISVCGGLGRTSAIVLSRPPVLDVGTVLDPLDPVIRLTDSTDSFKAQLKTHLFAKAYHPI